MERMDALLALSRASPERGRSSKEKTKPITWKRREE